MCPDPAGHEDQRNSGMRRGFESSKSFVEGATWHGIMDTDLGRVPGTCYAKDPRGILRSHLGISLGLSFPLYSKRCA